MSKLHIYRCSGVVPNLPHIDGEIEMVNKDYSVPVQQNVLPVIDGEIEMVNKDYSVPVQQNKNFDVQFGAAQKDVTRPYEHVNFELTNKVYTMSAEVANDIKQSGWMRNETLRQYLGTSKDGGCAEYFLYTFIPEEDLAKYNAVIYRKRQGQLKTYEYVRELFVGHNYGTEQELVNIIRSGIETTFGMSVEDVLAGIRSGDVKGVGDPFSAAIASIIVAIITLVTAVISGVIKYCQSVKIAKYTAPTFQELEDSTPAATDFTKKTKRNGLLIAAACGIGLLLISKKRK